MADNTSLNPGASGDVIRSKDRTGVKTQIVMLDLNTSGSEDLVAGQLPVQVTPKTTGGCSIYHAVAAASANAANIKASAGQIYAVTVFNNAVYPIFVKFHNTAGTPTAGTGVVKTIGVQAGITVPLNIPVGIAFGTGIGITIVKGIADADTTAVAASDCVVDVEYK